MVEEVRAEASVDRQTAIQIGDGIEQERRIGELFQSKPDGYKNYPDYRI